MNDPAAHDVTELLAAWSAGDEAALERLAPLIQAELHRIARRYLGRERQGHTLQPTALVNEAFVRLISWKEARFRDRAHFFGVSAQLMRRILVDFARGRPRTPGGAPRLVALDEATAVSDERGADIVALDEALKELARLDPRKAQVVELRFFGGLTAEEAAEFLGVSAVTVMREWSRAKAWLYRELNRTAAGDG